VIQYAVEEAVASGIEQIVIVVGSGTSVIEEHFDSHPALERWLEDRGDIELLRAVRKQSEFAAIAYVRQKEPLGLGHAILMAKELIGDEPFVRLSWGGVEGRLTPLDLDRTLMTVLFTDIVDSTLRAASIGDRAWKQTVADHHRRTREVVERYRGVEVDAIGDGFFFVFDSPARAVRCAEAIATARTVRPSISARALAETANSICT